MQRKPPPLNQLAIWTPLRKDPLSIKAYGIGYPFMDRGIVQRSSLTNPINRYAKNYTKGKKKFSIGIITTEPDSKKIEKWLNSQSKKIDTKDIDGTFKILDVHYS